MISGGMMKHYNISCRVDGWPFVRLAVVRSQSGLTV